MLMTMLMLMWCQCQCKCKISGAGCDLPCPVGHLSCPCHCPLFKQVGVGFHMNLMIMLIIIMMIMLIMLMIMMTMMILTRVVECWCSGEKGTSSWTLSTLPNAISPSLLTRWYIIISVASGVMYTLPNPNATNPSLLTRSSLTCQSIFACQSTPWQGAPFIHCQLYCNLFLTCLCLRFAWRQNAFLSPQRSSSPPTWASTPAQTSTRWSSMIIRRSI